MSKSPTKAGFSKTGPITLSACTIPHFIALVKQNFIEKGPPLFAGSPPSSYVLLLNKAIIKYHTPNSLSSNFLSLCSSREVVLNLLLPQLVRTPLPNNRLVPSTPLLRPLPPTPVAALVHLPPPTVLHPVCPLTRPNRRKFLPTFATSHHLSHPLLPSYHKSALSVNHFIDLEKFFWVCGGVPPPIFQVAQNPHPEYKLSSHKLSAVLGAILGVKIASAYYIIYL